ncbi:hybrid sensor histidine kinase/response regulator [Enterovibrio calviensis]|uniref:hybrid sensor histidine kinase/response regulator n=1 Tax=Enterovibrio calviensis TaxID=91359 RepID=UPI001B805BC0|nr:hybrid sensor histidine kinase/response regulator [Enterovibrio calviensis]
MKLTTKLPAIFFLFGVLMTGIVGGMILKGVDTLQVTMLSVLVMLCSLMAFNIARRIMVSESQSLHSDDPLILRDIQHHAIETITTGIVVTDARQTNQPIIYVNKAFETLSGLKANDVIGRSIDVLHGEEYWPNVSASIVSDEHGQPKFYINSVEDNAARIEAELELFSAKETRDELLRGMKLASNAGGICNWSLDINSGELTWDKAMFQLYGVSGDKPLTYEDWRTSIHPEDVEYAEKEVGAALEANTLFNAEFRIIHGFTGEVRWIKAAGDVYHNPSSEQYTLFGINLDITDERILQKKLEQESKTALQASEAKSRFLATMSHEIRTPMNGVIGMIDLLRESELTKEQLRMTTTIRDSSFSLLEIINDVLDFSKIESGQMALEYRDTDLLSVIEKTLEVLSVTAQTKGVTLHIHHDFRLPKRIKLDSVRIRQVLLNLVGNAIKFSNTPDPIPYQKPSQKASVIVSTEYIEDSASLRISVSDMGIGMTKSQIDKLFKPFTQADNSTTRKFGGTGLGLSITKSFVEMMKGQISATSQPDIGSEFTITIPLHRCATDDTLLGHYDFHEFTFVLMIENEEIYQTCEHVLSQCLPKTMTREMPTAIDNTDHIIIVTLNEPFKRHDQTFKNIVLDTEPSDLAGYLSSQLYFLGVKPLNPSEMITAISVLCGFESPDYINAENASVGSLADDLEDNDIDKDGIVILCAEDQPTNRLVLERQLSNLGYRFEMTKNGVEALNKWKSGRYPVVLTDCHMPEMDGFELVEEIRAREAEQHHKTLIIAVTANALLGEADSCKQAGMDDYITKPVELKKLRTVLATNIRNSGVNAVAANAVAATAETDLFTEPSVNDSSSTPPLPIAPIETNLIDFEHLRGVIGTDDKKMIEAVLSIFWESLMSDLALLDKAVADKNDEQIGVLAHGIKGSAASSGALSLSECFKEMEACKSDLARVTSILAEVKVMIGGIETVLIKETDITFHSDFEI